MRQVSVPAVMSRATLAELAQVLRVIALAVLVACGSKSPRQVAEPAPIHNVAPARSEAVALALVVNGQEVWIGNDDIEPELDDTGKPNPARYPGALAGIREGFTQRALVDTIGRDGLITLIWYRDRAEVGVPMRPATEFDAALFGTQKDHYMKIGTELVQGVELGIEQLVAVKDRRRVLVVVGDGNDTDNDAARERLAALKRRAERAQIKIRALLWSGPLSDIPGPIRSLTDDVRIVHSPGGMGAWILNAAKP